MIPASLKFHLPLLCFGWAYLTLTITFLHEYFIWTPTLLTALIAAPYICTTERENHSLRYLIPAIIIAGIALMVPVKTMLFLAILFAAILMVESSIGKINDAFILLLLLSSPLFTYANNAIGFPIRLWLSKQAVWILNYAGHDFKAEGNLIRQGQLEFSVDQACAGLNMLAVSFIFILFTITYFQKRLNQQISFLQVLLLATLTFVLNILSNLFRIILLVTFKIGTESIFHELIGTVCFVVYLLIPLIYITNSFFKYFARPRPIRKGHTTAALQIRYPLAHMVLLCTVFFISLNLKSMDQLNGKAMSLQLPGYKKQTLANGIMKFENSRSLIYIKPTVFYAPEHNPMICWKGSGYEFKSIRKQMRSGKEVYTGILTKGKDKIYTSWWFESKNLQSINQFDWRWKALKDNDQFYLININASSPSVLLKIATDMLGKRI